VCPGPVGREFATGTKVFDQQKNGAQQGGGKRATTCPHKPKALCWTPDSEFRRGKPRGTPNTPSKRKKEPGEERDTVECNIAEKEPKKQTGQKKKPHSCPLK